MYPYSNSKITLELRELLSSTDENGKPFQLWDFDYPSYYQDAAKIAFEKKVTDHFLFRQIGAETPGRFKHYFKTKMCEIMPYYVQLYETERVLLGIDDIFRNVDITETFEQESTGTSSGSHTTKSTGTTDTTESGTVSASESLDKTNNKEERRSNTPMGSVDNLDNYLSEAGRENGSSNESSTSDTTTGSTINGETSTDSEGSTESSTSGTIKHTFTKKGNHGVNTYAHDMLEYRKTILNIDMMIINDLNDLFLRVY